MSLKELDIVVILKLVAIGERRWSYPVLAEELFLSPSGVHGSVKRAVECKLLDREKKKPRRTALEEFLIHGIKYVFPPKRGSLTRGMPTGYATPPLNTLIVQSTEHPPVWPYAKGTIRGYAFSPLHESVPLSAQRDAFLYELLALVDAIRGGRAREVSIAVQEIRTRLGPRKKPGSFAEMARQILKGHENS
ncbi:hypothetical protein [Desulfomonile tiedjei]|uniref:Uncharacterized protein n=1 Tax=Desulfomonile tiedjei (strain ATCC 49306 / DSM 6799 / DCB-1) TaxID=706587 RepID=I4CCU5_DESTA|nr:hypothetical protein [Desulfomonile tiedjei]AFM27386.1 hypothetical protein Desti_4767 [Desulfomonile tiedjei DSM 6799]